MSPRLFLLPTFVALASAASAQFNFQPQVPYNTQGPRLEAVVAGEFNQQYGTDFAVTSGPLESTSGPNWVQIFGNTGNGTFSVLQTIFLGNDVGAASVVAADFDADADLDLAVTLRNINVVQILINTGGAFLMGATVPVGGVEPYNMAAADMDGDSDIDLITSNRTSNSLSVLKNDGVGSFTLAGTITVGLEPRFLALEDFNGDCATDIAVASHGNRRIDVLFNIGAGTFSAVTSFPIPGNEQPRGLVAADLDADGDIDLAATTDSNNLGLVVVMRNAGSGSFSSLAYSSAGISPDAIVAGDFDADGDKDLATTDEVANQVSVLANIGSAVFGSPYTWIVGSHPSCIARADVDGNGSLDIVVANRDSSNAGVLMNWLTGGTDNFCATTNNSVGFGTRIDTKDSLSVSAANFTLLARCAPPNTPGLFFQGTGTAHVAFASGFMCLSGQLLRLPIVMTGPTGQAFTTIAPSNYGVTAGSTRYYQFWHRDAGATVDLSDGLRATFRP
jgi:hypothetical protein